MPKKIFIFTGLIIAIALASFFIFHKGISVTGVKAEDNPIAQGKESETPDEFKAVYLTSWSAANPDKIDYIISLSKEAVINSVVIDIKDWSGKVPYRSGVDDIRKYGAERIIIPDISKVIDELHKENIYVIARITVFQDPVLANARPDLAVRRKSDQGIWLDYKGIAWINPSKKEAWDYNISLAKDALNKGFDEINFDYVRFPSDGDLKDLDLSGVASESGVIDLFFKYLRESMPSSKLSIDLFGLSTVNRDDLGIGQIIEDGYKYFDYICPMVYPSHYAKGFLGFDNPAEHPFEVVAYSMAKAYVRLEQFKKDNPGSVSKLRPWLQDFDMGSVYDTNKVLLQMKAVNLFLGNDYAGYMLWNPANVYDEEAIKASNNF